MRLRRVLTGLGALLVLAVILVGLPVVLIALGGNPLPSSLPDLGQLRDVLTTRDDGTVVLAAAKVLGWLVWAAFAVSILVEIPAQLRGVKAPQLPALSLPQSTTHGLVAAALALFLTAPAAVNAATPASATHPTTTTQQSQTGPIDTGQRSAGATEVGPTPTAVSERRDGEAAREVDTVVVEEGDTLSGLAAEHLDDGTRWPELYEASDDVVQPDGRTLQDPDLIHPGWQITLPAQAERRDGQASRDADTVVVEEGDTLSGLAAEHLDDGTRWPELYEASDDVVQPDGRTLQDPDLIHPGWQITLPEDHPEEQAAPLVDRAHRGAETGARVGGSAPAPDESTAQAGNPAGPVGAARDGSMASLTAGSEDSTSGDSGAVGALTPAGEEAEHRASSGDAGAEATDDAGPSWLLTGLTGSGALLAGGLFLALGRRRRRQFRHRRPGRTVSTAPQQLAPVAKTVHAHGAVAAPTLEDLDATLRRLAAQQVAAGGPTPVLVAAQLCEDALVLHLSEPADLQTPWQGSTDRLHWSLPAGTGLDQVGPGGPDLPAAWPLLVSIGAGDDGSAWLLNLEDLQVSLSGDPDYTADFARYIAAEIAVNPWSAEVRLDCVGIAEEVALMNPSRVHVAGPETIGDLHRDAQAVHQRLGQIADTATARAMLASDDTWPARILMLGPGYPGTELTAGLREAMGAHPGRTGSALVLHTDVPDEQMMQLVIGSDGRLRLPQSGLELVAAGLTPDEAQGCALLLAQGEDLHDVPMPVASEGTENELWRSFADDAGALRPEHTVERRPHLVDADAAVVSASSLLPGPDGEYVHVAATTEQDLAQLAPRVPQAVASDVLEADPDLDQDLADWWDRDSRRPRLTLLGPVAAKAYGAPLPDRKAYFTELLAYLVLHPRGVTPAQTADAFGLSEAKCRDYIRRVREWLGPNATDGQPHLPHAQKAPARQEHGTNVYQVLGVLCDLDLFRRLRARGEARGGAEGIEDLRHALSLVTGEPFSQLRRTGWSWLVEGDRVDQHMVCAIVDVAHILVVHDLQCADLVSARAAAQTATLAAPYEEIPTLDLAAVLTAEGHHGEAATLLQEAVCDRTEEEGTPPEDLPARTEQVLARRSWMEPRRAG
ncbi:LysM peptidoglycan-binding domain-containing protein [uncultured Serinicoccus sp.]|uniref:LysM peptidoglycan-binding domain-containing protein n=1 Tax=uncultured Serinicoccus sp. TaxID=735514 RepID=UPI002603200E|nr:LysM peptidoglycan-binding domain-containing protein [uncultured Serinicoccus sp.]